MKLDHGKHLTDEDLQWAAMKLKRVADTRGKILPSRIMDAKEVAEILLDYVLDRVSIVCSTKAEIKEDHSQSPALFIVVTLNESPALSDELIEVCRTISTFLNNALACEVTLPVYVNFK